MEAKAPAPTLLETYNEAAAQISLRNDILVVAPYDYDADALASCPLIGAILQCLRKRHTFFCAKPVRRLNALYEYLPLEKFHTTLPDKKPNCVIAVDYGDFHKLGINPEAFGPRCFFIGFDHHDRPAADFPKNGVQIVDSRCPSSTAVIYHFLKYLGIPLSKTLATYVAVGIFSDVRRMTEIYDQGTYSVISQCGVYGAPLFE